MRIPLIILAAQSTSAFTTPYGYHPMARSHRTLLTHPNLVHAYDVQLSVDPPCNRRGLHQNVRLPIDPFNPKDLAKLSNALAAGGTAAHALLLSSFDKIGNAAGGAFSSVLQNMFGTQQVAPCNVPSASLEAHMLSDMSHVALDVCSIAAPNVVAGKFAAVLGHLFSMFSDFVPDHFISPDDWVFQVMMLYTALSALFKSVSHQTTSQYLLPTTHRDLRAFKLLFKPAGMTIHQYKTFTAFAADWVAVDEGDVVVHDDDYTYLLYEGRVTVDFAHSSRALFDLETRPTNTKMVEICPLGAMGLLEQLDAATADQGFEPSAFLEWMCTSSVSDDEECPLEIPEANERWTIGPNGATLLRLKTKSILSLLEEYDPSLEKPLRNFLLRGIQAGFTAALSR